jgi:cysteine desulfurase/selenocysteine lyase
MFDPVKFKKNFPLFAQVENQSLVYLDNAATTHKPQCVIDAIVNFYIHENGNANRASHRLARTATAMMEGVRQQAAHFLGAASKNEIVFTTGATAGMNLLANGLSASLNKGDEVLVSSAEHHANLVPWQEAAEAQNLKLVFCDYELSNLKEKITHRTKIISVLAASNVLGKKYPLTLFLEIKRTYPNIILILDASQIIGHELINLQDGFCDFLVCSAHKFYGPTGIGLLYGRYEQLLKVKPNNFGGEMIKKVGRYSSSYADAPYVFEAGTSSLAAIAGLGACISYLTTEDVTLIAKHEKQLTSYLHQKLLELTNTYRGLTLLTTAKENVGIAAIAGAQYSMADIGFWLDEADVAVRVGDHCTQPLLNALGVDSILRVSIAAYNTFDDVDTLCCCLYEFLKENDVMLEKKVHLVSGEKPSLLITDNEFTDSMSGKDRYKKILMAGKLVEKKEYLRKDENLVAGCESSLWVIVDKKILRNNDAICCFTMDSDSNLVKGLADLILRSVNGLTKSKIEKINFELYLNSLGLNKYLSESRISGIKALVEFIRAC